ncbi:MAG: polymer-forming cytoskeletal protein [Deltaproteobacteria bacterium]|nr:polymer-forming cytoskeletal protein [Deltaproteobacteria bacterium]MBW2150345.1 polymer-forming cytoskeletal protein [Deltaproteobacteria bacterium]
MKKNKKLSAFLGEDTEVEGKLKFHGTLRIDGRFKGEITAIGSLVIGEGGVIEADIHATNVLSSGEIRGAVSADEVIEILEPGKVFGNIEAPNVVIHPGVIFEGNCWTHAPKKRVEEEQVVVIRDAKAEKKMITEQ